MLRGDEMDIDFDGLETFLPAPIGLPVKLKTKTSKTR